MKKKMKLNLTKPLIVFDLETTGLDLATDRIIQVSYIKVKPNGDEERKSVFVNPEKSIPPTVQELTHITDEMVKDAPTFKQIGKKLCDTFAGCDFAGFNSNRFDIPMLAEEFLRAGIDFDFTRCRLIDAQNIFHKMEPRNLAAAYRYYTGRKMEDDFQAHRADEDAEATYRVLQGQMDRYNPEKPADPEKTLANDMDTLADFSAMNDNVDFAGRIVWQEMTDAQGKPLLDDKGKPKKQEVFNFGKYKGTPVIEVVRKDPGFCSWMLSANFTLNTKQALTRIQLREAKLNMQT